MPFRSWLSRERRGCVLLLVDQSRSMADRLGKCGPRKGDMLVDAVNSCLREIVMVTTRCEGVRDYCDIGVIGYRTDPIGKPIVAVAFTAPALAGRNLVPIPEVAAQSHVAQRKMRIPDDEKGELIDVLVEVPLWIGFQAEGGTPMCHAFKEAYGILAAWIENHGTSFPPLVLHYTDGDATDGDPLPYAEAIRRLATDDGQVLLFNCLLSARYVKPLRFPSSSVLLQDSFARLLFNMSSELPEHWLREALCCEEDLQPLAQGLVVNADMVALLRFLDWGGDRIARCLP